MQTSVIESASGKGVKVFMSEELCKCNYCKYRHSWDCDDGLLYPKNGCEDFVLDKDTISKETRELLLWLEEKLKENF